LPSTKRDLGEWFNRLVDCVEPLLPLFTAALNLPSNSNPQAEVRRIKAALFQFLEGLSISNCALFQLVSEINLSDGATPAEITEVQQRLEVLIVELGLQCICSSLLPPCPMPADDNCVPVATLTLNCRDGCNVVRICNLEHRKMVVTWPIVGYYLGGILKALNITEFIERLCCSDLFGVRGTTTTTLAAGAAAPPPDPIRQMVRDVLSEGGKVDRGKLFKRIGAMVQDIPARILNQSGGSNAPKPN
jgi:hypothetical protein